MRVRERGSLVVVEDTPGCLWVFGLWFVAGGALALAMLWIATNRDELTRRQTMAVVGIGTALVLGGALVVGQHRATRTTFDRSTGDCTRTVRGFLRRGRRDHFRLTDTRALEIVRSRDNDGDPMALLRLWLSDSRSLDLQAQPVRGVEHVERVGARLAGLIGLGRQG